MGLAHGHVHRQQKVLDFVAGSNAIAIGDARLRGHDNTI